MAVAGALDWDAMRTTLRAYGWLVWPLAWLAQALMLHAVDRARDDDSASPMAAFEVPGAARTGGSTACTRLSAIAFVVWLAWEASEWVGHACPGRHGVDAVCGGVAGHRLSVARDGMPRLRALAVARAPRRVCGAVRVRCSPRCSAPGSSSSTWCRRAIRRRCRTSRWRNPLDVTLVAALAVLFLWARAVQGLDERTRLRLVGRRAVPAGQRARVPRGPPVARRAVALVGAGRVEAAAGGADAHLDGRGAAADAGGGQARDPSVVDGGRGTAGGRRRQAVRARPRPRCPDCRAWSRSWAWACCCWSSDSWRRCRRRRRAEDAVARARRPPRLPRKCSRDRVLHSPRLLAAVLAHVRQHARHALLCHILR